MDALPITADVTKGDGSMRSWLKSIEPDWSTCDIGSYLSKRWGQAESTTSQQSESSTKGTKIYQQSDLLKPMLTDIAKYGLQCAYQTYKGASLPITGQTEKGQIEDIPMIPLQYSKTKNKKHIIIVGAGLAGLSAAYELTKVGHEVDILEMQNRVGGRVKTLRERDGFSKHCHTEG